MELQACMSCSVELRHLSSHQAAVACRLRRNHNGSLINGDSVYQPDSTAVCPQPLSSGSIENRRGDAPRRSLGGQQDDVEELKRLPGDRRCINPCALPAVSIPVVNLTIFETLLHHRPLFAPVRLCRDSQVLQLENCFTTSVSLDQRYPQEPYVRIGLEDEVERPACISPVAHDRPQMNGYVLMSPLTLIRSLGVPVGREEGGVRVVYCKRTDDEMSLLDHVKTLREQGAGSVKSEGVYFEEIVIPIDVVTRLLNIDFSLGMAGFRSLASLSRAHPERFVSSPDFLQSTSQFAEGTHSGCPCFSINSSIGNEAFKSEPASVPFGRAAAGRQARVKSRQEKPRTVAEKRTVTRLQREWRQASVRAELPEKEESIYVEAFGEPNGKERISEGMVQEPTTETPEKRKRVPAAAPEGFFSYEDSDEERNAATSDEYEEKRVKRTKAEGAHDGERSSANGVPAVGSPRKPKEDSLWLKQYADEARELGPHPPGVLWARTSLRWFVSFWGRRNGPGRRPRQKTFTVAKYGGVANAYNAALKFHIETRGMAKDRPIGMDVVLGAKVDGDDGRTTQAGCGNGDTFCERRQGPDGGSTSSPTVQRIDSTVVDWKRDVVDWKRDRAGDLHGRTGDLHGVHVSTKREETEMPQELADVPMPPCLTWSANACALRASARGRVRWFGTRRREVMEAYSRAVEWLEGGKGEGADRDEQFFGPLNESGVYRQGSEEGGPADLQGQANPAGLSGTVQHATDNQFVSTEDTSETEDELLKGAAETNTMQSQLIDDLKGPAVESADGARSN
eukprot:GHVS01106565.1.p1 GENE.GHVS01106565.1~~GHVS01106565.1.p1  ORF type:complete len:793 (+),score=78.82 GHVS01106565.1:110-2488(+)